jgi:uncharacterized membrane protein
MNTTYWKPLVWGFLFGTVGMYALAMLSLMFQTAELITRPLFVPGRYLSERFAGAEGSTLEVLLLTFANGLFYALLFLLIAVIINAVRGDRSAR